MREERILNMLKEVIEDKKTGERFWFDIDSYKEARDYPKPLSTRDICTKLELNTDIEVVSGEAIRKRVLRFNNYVDDCESAVKGDVEFIKYLGLALSENEMAFLKPISLISFAQIVEAIKIRPNLDGVHEIYNQLNHVLYLLEISCYFNYIPNTEEFGETYFENLMVDIRKDVDQMFGDNRIVRRKLYELIDEVDFIINSCEVPGVPESWISANPKIKYFDCVFEMIEENLELYFEIRERNMNGSRIGFRFYPTIKEVMERRAFFEEKKQRYPNRSDERLYQDELVEALNIRFNECILTIKEALEDNDESKV